MKARMQVVRTNTEQGVSKIEQDTVYKIGTCTVTNARKVEKKVLSTKYRGVFAKLSWVNNPTFNSKTAILKSGEIMNLIITPANDEAVVTFAESERKANGEKLAFTLEKQTRPISGSIEGELIGKAHNFTAPNERVAKGTINKDANYVAYDNGNWQNLPFNAGSYKTAENGQTIIVLKCLGPAEDG